MSRKKMFNKHVLPTDNFIDELSVLKNYRFERKFTIPDSYSIQEVEQQIKSNSWLFREVFHERQVNNIYFDSHDFKNYVDNVYGLSERKKIRIRWYGEAFGRIQNPVLEIKTKKGLVGNKWSYSIKPFNLDNRFTRDYIRIFFGHSKLPGPIFEDLVMTVPTLLNSYRRRYYISSDQRFRITLDFSQRYHNIDTRFNNFEAFPKKDPNKIIELKYGLSDDDDARRICSQFSARLNKNSKYVNGIFALKQIPQ